jgi:two-component system chemotaxis sensor kinase CheA
MMPMEVVFSRFPRMVRELSTKLGKQINLVTQGNSIELDKGLIEKIVDPLTHLVRNSIDHGIESPEVRLEKGKPVIGRLGLSAIHQGGHVLIEVTDDGAGLNRDKILNKARAEGIAIRDGITDEEVWQLIFAPGFSTADAVTDLSGRGVGMDVVKRNIISLGGTVNVQSAAGVGTITTVSLPLTLAILDGMSVKVGDETYILPLNYVVESFQPSAANIKEISGQGTVIFVRGEYLPIVALHRVFNTDTNFSDPLSGILVIIASEDRKAALLVDELVGQQQIVVKNIESNYRKVPNISGATIMGDGSVSLIIDVTDLLRSNYTRTSAEFYRSA